MTAAAATAITEALRFVEETPRTQLLDVVRPPPRRGFGGRVPRVEPPRPPRESVEAPWALTLRFLRLEAAWGLVRVGSTANGLELARPVLHELSVGRPVERCLAALFDCRLQQASDGDSTSAWSEGVVGQLAALDTFEKYQVQRVMEFSQVLTPRTVPNPGGEFRQEQTTETERSVPFLDRSEDFLGLFAALPRHAPTALRASVGYLRAAARFGLPGVTVGLDLMRPRWPAITDTYSTNAYCCVTALAFFDGMIFAIAEAVKPIDVAIPNGLHSAILSNPDAPGPYLVLADWIQEHSPSQWGELIAVQCKGEAAPDDAMLIEREGALVARLEPFSSVGPEPGRSAMSRCDWRWGAVRAAKIVGDRAELARQTRALLTSPRGRYLRGLELGLAPTDRSRRAGAAPRPAPPPASRLRVGQSAARSSPDDTPPRREGALPVEPCGFQEALELLAMERPRVLRSLSLRDQTPRDNAVEMQVVGDFSSLWVALPSLAELVLVGDFRVGQVPVGRLHRLTVEFSGPSVTMNSLESAPLDGLEHLNVWVGDAADAARIEAWITPERMPALRELTVGARGGPAPEVNRWAITPQLRQLRLFPTEEDV